MDVAGRTRLLISEAGISDYVLSNELVSRALAMVAEDRRVNAVIQHLFQAEGSELYFRSAMSRHARVFSFFSFLREKERKTLLHSI